MKYSGPGVTLKSDAKANMRPFLIALFGLLTLLSGCDQEAFIEKMTPQAESAIAKQLLGQLAARNFPEVEKQLDASLRTPALRSQLEKIAEQFPNGTPASVKTVGSITSISGGVKTFSFTYEYEYPGAWVLANISLDQHAGQMTVKAVHAKNLPHSLKDEHRFTFKGKGLIQYVTFALCIFIPLLIIYALVLCYKTPVAKRKWLWYLFIALGIVQFSLNWTDGSYLFAPFSFLLLGAGFVQSGPYAPMVLSIALPVGAIVFLARRQSRNPGSHRD